MSIPLRQSPPFIKLLFPLALLAILIVITVKGAGNEEALDNMTAQPNMSLVMKIAQVISVLIVFVIPAFLMAFMLQPNGVRSLQLHRPPAVSSFFLVIVLMIAALPLINWLAELNNQMRLPASMSGLEEWMKASEEKLKKLTDMFMSDTSVGGLILNLFVIAFMAALSEELFFRGVLQTTMIQATRNVHLSIWITAALFSAIHLQFYGFLPRMVLGAVMGYLFVWSRSLWVPILAHFVNNGFAVVLSWLMARKSIEADSDKVGAQEGEMVFTIVSITIFFVLMFTIWKIEKKRPKIDDDHTAPTSPRDTGMIDNVS
jgi:membrane protease YdiL (CAAX protease family)